MGNRPQPEGLMDFISCAKKSGPAFFEMAEESLAVIQQPVITEDATQGAHPDKANNVPQEEVDGMAMVKSPRP